MTSLADRIRAALAEPAPAVLDVGGDRASAVLVAVLLREAGPRLLFVRKAATLRKHAGQVSFPGGAVDPGDGSPEAAALREAEEEVGLPPSAVTVLGRLDDDRTYVTAYHICAVVALVADPPVNLRPDPFEIDAILEIDFRAALDADPAGWNDYEVAGFHYRAPRFELPGPVTVWGATGRILYGLQRRLRAAEAAGGPLCQAQGFPR